MSYQIPDDSLEEFLLAMDLFHNDVTRGKRDVRRNLIGLKRTFIIAEPIKFRVSSSKPRLTGPIGRI